MDGFNKRTKYEFVPPEGGWGYLIAAGHIISVGISLFSMQTFGIVFGSFLDSFGNEARDISTLCSLFHTVFFLTGLPANVVLQKMSHRKVALLGSLIYVLGSIATIFVTSPSQLIITYCVLQGFGMGLFSPSSSSIFFDYFHLRKNFVMNCSKVVMSITVIISPSLTRFWMDRYGFRGTLALVAAVSSHMIFAAVCLHPVKWHMKKRRLHTPLVTSEFQANTNTDAFEKENLLHNIGQDNINGELKQNSEVAKTGKIKKSNVWKFSYAVYKTLDLQLFKDPIYINVVVGVSLLASSDIICITFTPLLLKYAGFDENEVTLLITILFICDLIGRLSLCALTGMVDVRNRYLQLVGAIISATLRLVFVLNSSFWWAAFVCGMLGYVRCLVHNTTTLVFAEIYPKRFVTTYTLFMVVSAVVMSSLGQIIGYATTLTPNKNIIWHILGIAPSYCAMSWLIELLYPRLRKRLSRNTATDVNL